MIELKPNWVRFELHLNDAKYHRQAEKEKWMSVDANLICSIFFQPRASRTRRSCFITFNFFFHLLEYRVRLVRVISLAFSHFFSSSSIFIIINICTGSRKSKGKSHRHLTFSSFHCCNEEIKYNWNKWNIRCRRRLHVPSRCYKVFCFRRSPEERIMCWRIGN